MKYSRDLRLCILDHKNHAIAIIDHGIDDWYVRLIEGESKRIGNNWLTEGQAFEKAIEILNLPREKN